MNNTIRYFDRNDKLLDERTFEISVTKDMVIRTGINKDKDTVLQIDKNKDGKVDEKISASKNRKNEVGEVNSLTSIFPIF